MKDRSQLNKLMEECVTDAKNITIYRELQPAIISTLFQTRLSELPDVIPEPVTTPTVEDATIPDNPVETVTETPNETTDVTVNNEATESATPNTEETQNDETKS